MQANKLSVSRATTRTQAVQRALHALVLSVSLGACGGGALTRQAVDLNARGAALLANGRIADAEASFRLALEYGGRFAEPHNNLGLAALARGAVREARAHFRAALLRNPDFAEAWSNLGVALARRVDARDEESTPEAVRAAFREALEANPGYVEARVNLCRWLLERGEVSEALEQSRRLVQVAPESALARALRAEAALAMGGRDEALGECAEGARIEPRDVDVRLVCARTAMASGDVNAAAPMLDALLDDPRVGLTARAHRAAVYFAVGDRARAARMLATVTGSAGEAPIARMLRASLRE